jgi:exopolysaccharide production protein ExoY
MGMTGGDSEMGHLGQEHVVAPNEAAPRPTTARPAPATTATGNNGAAGGSRAGTSGSSVRQRQDGARSNGASPSVTPVADVTGVPPATPARSRAKRALDLGITAAVLPVAGLLAAGIGILVATTSRGPVLFLQERVGLGGRTFRMVKFRTMEIDAERRLRSDPELWSTYVDNDYKLPADSDPRLTRVGRLLRRWSLDELPQVLNVLTGSMSWVGPRPVTPDQLEDWGPDSGAYLSVRPGITGWWQINGRSDVQSMDRIAYDRDYADSWNLWLDVRILARTPAKVIHGKGAF